MTINGDLTTVDEILNILRFGRSIPTTDVSGIINKDRSK